MTERENLPAVIASQTVVVLSEQRASLVGRGLAALRKDNEELYRQARVVFDRQEMTWHFPYQIGFAISSAFKILQQLANEDFGKAYYPLSILYGGKRGIEKNLGRVRHFAHLAFNWCFDNRYNQDAELWCDLGRMYCLGHGVEKNYGEAVKWYRLAAEHGQAEAQQKLGTMYFYDWGVPNDVEEALKWWRLAADQNHAVAQIQLAVLNCHPTPLGIEEKLKWLRLAANQGLREAVYTLGQMYRDGDEGVPQDYEEAVKWFRMGAELGHDDAYRMLESMYVDGQAIAPSDEQTVCWHRKCAEQGNTEAQWRLGDMYFDGRGVPEDDEEAVKWFLLSADQGNPTAQEHLGYLYTKGVGVPQDYEKAGKWLLLAAEQGNRSSEIVLSQMYKNGQGVLQDYEEVVKRYQLGVADRAAAEAARGSYSEVLNRGVISKKKLAALGDADAQKYLQELNIDWKE